jgi:WD40 repeat protein
MAVEGGGDNLRFGVLRGNRVAMGVLAAACASALLVVLPSARAHDVGEGISDAIIGNGTVQLGLHPFGHLNVPGGSPSLGTGSPSGPGETTVGLRFVPTNADTISPACDCEGWGVADAETGRTAYANQNELPNVNNLVVESFASSATTATSVVRDVPIEGDPSFRVTHAFAPSPETPNLYEVTVSIENTSESAITDLRYRRVMDWDVEPTAFNEFVTIDGTAPPELLYSSNNGFATANPLGSRTAGIPGTDLEVSKPEDGPFEPLNDAGPKDHGALFDFGFGSLPAGETKTFTFYYGGAATETAALAAIDAVGAELYSLGQPNPDLTEETNTFIFAYASPGVSNVALEVDQASVNAPVQTAPLSAVPPQQLPFFSGAPNASPVGSIPVGSIGPVGSIPVGSIPVASIPVASIGPVASIPVASIGPVGSIPVGSIGLDQVLLSSLPVDWGPIVAGTPLAGLQVRTLTLQDIYDHPIARDRYLALTLVQSGLARSLLGGTPLAAILLGDTTLEEIAPLSTATDWCNAVASVGASCGTLNIDVDSNTLVGLSIAGLPVASIPVASIGPVGSIPVASIQGGIAGTPVGSIPVASIEIAATRLASVPVASIPSPGTVVDCARVNCNTGSTDTLGFAASLSPSAIQPGAKLEHLAAVLGPPLNLTLNEIIIGLLGRSALPWEGFPIDGIQQFVAGAKRLAYQLDADVTCATEGGVTLRVLMPDGYLVVPGTSDVAYDSGAPLDAPDPAMDGENGATWTDLPGDPCAGTGTTRHVRLTYQAHPGFELGKESSLAVVSAGGDTVRANEQAPVVVTQNWELNDDAATAQAIGVDELAIGHIAASGDQEFFKLPIPPRGTRTTFLLSHIPQGEDFDLVVTKPAAQPLQSSPVASIPVASIPVEDTGSALDNAGTTLPPETLEDIPVGSIPVASISASRGNADETAQVVSLGETGSYTVAVSGYNGSHSDDPFVLRAKQTPPPQLPPCPARTFAFDSNPYGGGDENQTAGRLPTSIPTTTKTLFLVARNRMSDLYGRPATDAMLAALRASSGSANFAGRSEIRGAVLEVDGNAAVRAALQAWDANPCSIEAANAVVRAINAVVSTFRVGRPIQNVILLGTDEALPMARVPDLVSISPEFDEAIDLQFTTQNLTRANALYAAAATGHFLTDKAYAAFTQIPWLGRELHLPQVSVGRVGETPLDVQRQVQLYIAANGKLSAETALATGYDFLLDGGTAVRDALDEFVEPGTPTALLNDTWTRSSLQAVFTSKTPPDDVLSVNAHYSHWQAQPAAPEVGTKFTPGDLVTTGDLPALPANPAVDPAFARRILFTMGCHAGLNVADTLIGSPTPDQAQRLLDWTQGFISRQRSAVYVANTGFGYGDTEANALSERLMTIFAKRLGEGTTIGADWLSAEHEYFNGAGAYGVYDEKALVEATFYGFTFWQVDGATPPTPPTPPTLINDPVSELEVASVTVDTVGPGKNAPALEQKTTPEGAFWHADDETTFVHFRPIQPRIERDVTVPGKVAHGAVIMDLETSDVAGVNPLLAQPTIDLSDHELERNFRDVAFPASFLNLTRSNLNGSTVQNLVVTAGQFRPSTPPGPTGVERLVEKIDVEVAYSNHADTTPPEIQQVSSTFAGGLATIAVRTTANLGIQRVRAGYNDGSGWNFIELTETSPGNWFAGGLAAGGPLEVFAIAQEKLSGNTGFSTNKAFNFHSVVDTTEPEIVIDSPLEGGVFSQGQTVLARYACSDGGGVATCEGTVANGAAINTATLGPKTFTVQAIDRAVPGNSAELTVTYTVVPKIVFTSSRAGSGDIFSLGADGAGLVNLTHHSATDAAPTLSPNGEKIAFTSTRFGNAEILVMNANGTGVTRLTNNSAIEALGSWSPDGQKIAFTSTRDGNSEIYVMNADGTGVTRLTNDAAIDADPWWSPDGKIAFASNRDGNFEIYAMKTDGTVPTRLTNNPALDGEPVYSPDGEAIAFTSHRDGNLEIYSMSPNGGGETRLTHNSASDVNPDYSLDGSMIAFSSSRDGNFELYLMTTAGNGQARLTNHSAFDGTPDW